MRRKEMHIARLDVRDVCTFIFAVLLLLFSTLSHFISFTRFRVARAQTTAAIAAGAAASTAE